MSEKNKRIFFQTIPDVNLLPKVTPKIKAVLLPISVK